MESSVLFNSNVRVKEEPGDASISENYSGMIDEKPDLENFQLLPFPRENSTHTIQKCEENHEIELDNEVEIVAECEDVKPNIFSLSVKKIDDDSRNHLGNVKDSDDYETKSTVKIENTEKVKQECFDDFVKDLNSNFDRELSEKNKNISVAKKSVFNGYNNNCDTCGKKFGRMYHLKRHIDSMHNKITHTCDICGKNFKRKGNLKIHIDSIHRKITHVCDMCGKKFTQKNNLKIHVNAKHSNGPYGKNSK